MLGNTYKSTLLPDDIVCHNLDTILLRVDDVDGYEPCHVAFNSPPKCSISKALRFLLKAHNNLLAFSYSNGAPHR